MVKGLEGHLGSICPVNIVAYLLTKLRSACFLMRRLYYILYTDSLKIVYFTHFLSIVKYGIIFWGNQRDVNKLFILQKRVLRIMIGLDYRSLCMAWFKQLEILTVPCLYILSMAMFVICNSSHFKTNFSVYSKLTRQKNQIHKPLVKYTSIQSGITYSAFKVFNKLSLDIVNMAKYR